MKNNINFFLEPPIKENSTTVTYTSHNNNINIIMHYSDNHAVLVYVATALGLQQASTAFLTFCPMCQCKE